MIKVFVNRQKPETGSSELKSGNPVQKKAKRLHKELTMSKLASSIDRKELWAVVSELRCKKSKTPLTVNDLESHFSHLLNNAPKTIPDDKMKQLKLDLVKFLNSAINSDSDLMPGNYNLNFLSKIVKTLKKSPPFLMEL